MKYKFPSKLAMVFFAVIFCFISGCMHYKNYHVFLAKKFEVKSSISKKKYWKPIVFSLDEKKSYEYKSSLNDCEEILFKLKPNFAFVFSAQNIVLECMLGKGFEYEIEDIIVVK